MGNDISGPSSSNQLVSQRDNDLSFNSSSTSRPIGADVRVAKLSPRISHKNKSSKSPSFNNKIIVVASGKKKQDEDKLHKTLQNIPTLQPFIQPPSGIPFRTSFDIKTYRLDPKDLLHMCNRFREHVKVCTKECVLQQEEINNRVKEVNAGIISKYATVTEHRNRQAKNVEQVQKVTEMLSTLSRIHSSISQLVPLANQLNSWLPPQERLEDLVIKR